MARGKNDVGSCWKVPGMSYMWFSMYRNSSNPINGNKTEGRPNIQGPTNAISDHQSGDDRESEAVLVSLMHSLMEEGKRLNRNYSIQIEQLPTMRRTNMVEEQIREGNVDLFLLGVMEKSD